MANFKIITIIAVFIDHTRTTPSPAKDCTFRILALQYSQTGQLAAVMDAILAPLLQAGPRVHVHRETLRLAQGSEYPFPWPLWTFLDAFPETVAGEAPPLAPLAIESDPSILPYGSADFDLIILGFPVWFLSPPPALTAFFKNESARRLLAGKRVVTVTACRNMWLMAQEKVKTYLHDIGAHHCDHVALTDQGSSFATFITTPRWMLTGRRDAFWFFPRAGLTDDAIAACSRFGRALLAAIDNGSARTTDATAPLLTGLRACVVDSRLIASERIGTRSFRIWSKILRTCGRPGTPLRRVMLFGYASFLVSMIVTVFPLSLLVKAALRPFLRAKLARAKAYFEQPSGSGDERLALFS